MAKYSNAARFRETAGGVSVDPRVMDILQTAAAAYNLNVQFTSGVADRSAGTHNHDHGYAADIQLIDPSGNALPNYQNGSSFSDYEKFAQTAKVVQQQKYPELNQDFRWGGYFSNNGKATGYGAVDLMHFDINPKMKGAMGLGSWEHGASPALIKAYPGASTNGGLRAVGPALRAQVAGTPVPPGEIAAAPTPMPGRPAALSQDGLQHGDIIIKDGKYYQNVQLTGGVNGTPDAAGNPATFGLTPTTTGKDGQPLPPIPMDGRPAALSASGAPMPMPGRPAALAGPQSMSLQPPNLPLNPPIMPGNGDSWGPNTGHWGPQSFADALPRDASGPAAAVVAPTMAETRAEQAQARPAPPGVPYQPVARAAAPTVADTRSEQAQMRAVRPAAVVQKPDLVDQLAARAAIKTGGKSIEQRDESAAAAPGAIKTTMSPAGTVQLPAGVVPKSVQTPLNTPTSKTIANPAYAEWQKTQGTGGANATLEDIHDKRDAGTLAASVSSLKKAPTPAPPKTITITVPGAGPAAVKAPAKKDDGNGLGAILGNVLGFAQSKAADLGTAATKVAQKVATSAPEVAEKAKNAAINNLMSTVAGRTAVIDPMIANFMNPQGSTYKPATQAPSVDNANSKVAKAAASGQTMVDHTGKVVTAQVVQRYNPDTNTFENHVIAR